MANQMIALQARSPQLPDPARQNAQMAQMINMMQQQKAAERQAAQASQAMTFAANEESRRAALQAPNLKKAGAEADAALLKYYMDYTKASATDISNARDPQDAIARGDRLKRMFPEPELNTAVDETLASMPQDPALFGAWRDATLRRTLDAEKQLERKYENLFDADGNLITVETSPVGAFSPKVTPGVITDLPSTAPPPSPYAPRTPTTPQPSAMGREPSAASDAPMTFGPDATRPLNAYQQEDLRNLEAELGMQDTPASFTRGGMGGAGAAQMTPDVMSRIVDSAFETGVMAQVDFDQLLASQPPQNKQALVDSFQRANITLQADAPSLADSAMGQQQPMGANPVQTPQSQFADMRGPAPQSQTAGLRGAPPMEQTLAQYRVGQQVKGKNPNVAPFPASAQVPPSVLAAQEAAKTTAQEQAKEAAAAAAAPALAQRERNISYSKERGTADAKFMESASSVVEASNEGRNILNQMIGDAYIDKRGKIVVPKDGRRPHSGFEGVVGLGFPGMRFVPGSPEADFDKKFKQVVGKAFLKAFNDLRGGGSITEIEGVKATEAITRLSRSISEVEFIRAARELEDILAKGEQRALDRRARIEGKAAPRVSTPTSKKSKPRELVFNPATGDFD